MSKFMNEIDGGNLLSNYGISVVKSVLVKDYEELLIKENDFQYPVVMKILSPDIIHKTEAGCVVLNIKNIEELRKAYLDIISNGKKYSSDAKVDGVIIQEMVEKGLEIIIGMKKDPQFGNIIMFGTGGIYVEVHKDISIRLLPIEKYDALEMVKETRIYKIINGAREKYYNIDEILDVLLKISHLVEQDNSIEEIDINPFFIYENGKDGVAVDALIRKI